MLRHIFSRLIQSAVVLAVMSFVIYSLIGLMPGDPVDLMIAHTPGLTAEDQRRLRELHGLDQPLLGRYLAWAGNVLQGDLGYSRLQARPVLDALLPALGNSLILLVASLAVALAIALPLGVLAAMRPGSVFDTFVNMIAFAGISMPVFWLGLMLIVVFAVLLGWLPAGGVETIGGGGLADRALHLVLPVVTLAVAGTGQYVRHVRAAMIEILRQDHIRTAQAKGCSRRRIVMHHALRNAMIPVTTILALDIGAMFSGALITETVFAYPGMGKLIYDAVMGNDYNLALAGLLLATAMTLAGNLLADIAYAWLDPRISYR
ncbi:ABC transporter permease [Telmatospirillum sp. J64-1]|uniref:ABC transporter permease n=1 Tax=Telmatospirillum sp. J64-1 TaxID=2502183 RepID=UPI00115D0105|nr:ABC transporter permease [Telmatospirillum sp. J64-1]